MTEPIRVGIVGCGRLAEAGYIPAIERTPRLRVAAVTDADVDRARRVADLAGGAVQRFDTVADLASSGSVDVVLVATPVEHHLAAAEAVAAAGLPALVEKPPAPDSAGAERLVALDPAPWIGFNRRFDRGLVELRDALPADRWLDLSITLHYRRSSWQPVTVHDDALLDLGPHAADLARWLLGGEVTSVSRAVLSAERASFHVELERGRAQVDLAADRPHHERYEVRDRHGARLGRHQVGGLTDTVIGRLSGRTGPSALVLSLAGELDALVDELTSGPAGRLGTALDGAVAMRIVEAVRASAALDGRRTLVAAGADH